MFGAFRGTIYDEPLGSFNFLGDFFSMNLSNGIFPLFIRHIQKGYYRVSYRQSGKMSPFLNSVCSLGSSKNP